METTLDYLSSTSQQIDFNGTTTAPSMTIVSVTKLGLAAVMFIGVLAASLTPVLVIARLAGSMGGHSHLAMTSSPSNQEIPRWRHYFILWVGRLSCFSGGVFLSTGFMDLFPDVEAALQKAKIHLNFQTEFPMAPCFTLLGFFTILTIEQVVLVLKERGQISPKSDVPDDHKEPDTGHSDLVPNPVFQNDGAVFESTNTDDIPLMHNNVHTRRAHLNSTNSQDQQFPSLEGISSEPVYSRQASEVQLLDSIDSELERGHQTEGHGHSEPHQHSDHMEDLTMHSSLRVVILLCAMSVHAIFEGMAVGLQTTEQEVLELFFALCLHKLVIAASVGLSIATSGLSRCISLTACFILSSASPFGVICGFGVRWAEDNWGGGYIMANVVLQGLACGTFFFVVFFEILPHEFNTGLDRLGKVFSLLMGFGLVCVFIYYFPG